MILLDTNVIIDAQNKASTFFEWSVEIISEAVRTTGAAVNAITVAELCAGKEDCGSRSERTERRWCSSARCAGRGGGHLRDRLSQVPPGPEEIIWAQCSGDAAAGFFYRRACGTNGLETRHARLRAISALFFICAACRTGVIAGARAL